MRFGAFYAVCNISILFLSENAPKLKSVQTKGILGMQRAFTMQGQQSCKGNKVARATKLQGVLQQKKSLRRGSKQRGDLHLIVYIVTL